ncbi:MAG: ABC transporter ATP-binding protein [Lachnospiraceae bacterium]
MEESALIQLQKIEFSYREKKILSSFDFTFRKDTAYALIGQSGCGKSTLLKLLAGHLDPDSGTIHRSSEISNIHNGRTGFLFQDLALFPWQTVHQSVTMPLKLQRKSTTSLVDPFVENMLRDLGIWDKRDDYVKSLSGGEKQRAALARTLILRPDLLLMDEPTSALDMMTKEVFQELLQREREKHGFSMICVTHDIEEAVRLGEIILIMDQKGEIQSVFNPFYLEPNMKEDLNCYQFCIELRIKLGLGGNVYEE